MTTILSMSRNRTHAAITAPLIACLLLAGCSGDDKGGGVRPLVADITIDDTSATYPEAVYFRRASAAGEVVTVDVNLRTTTFPDIDAFTLEILFDPGRLQVRTVDWSDTPLGFCDSSTLVDGCTQDTMVGSPICCSNLGTDLFDGKPDANDTGDLFLVVAALRGEPSKTAVADQTLLTISFGAANPGTSRIRFVDGAGSGDCEILQGDPLMPLPIPCVDGMAEITASQ